MDSSTLRGLFALPLFLVACHSSDGGDTTKPTPGVCPTTICAASVGQRDDGTVDVEPAALWTDRGAEPAPLSVEEHVGACAVLARCWAEPSERRGLFELCVDPGWGFFWEERAVPTAASEERWSFEARRVLEVQNDCSAVLAEKHARPSSLICEEAGCWWAGAKPTVTCEGSVAHVTTGVETIVRDCSRAFAACDPASRTGCTDRAPVGCVTGSKDRCDGAVALGCDSTGKVTFHDCARVPGGSCSMDAEGNAVCKPSLATECKAGPSTCAAGALSLCVAGKKVSVPLADAGIPACAP